MEELIALKDGVFRKLSETIDIPVFDTYAPPASQLPFVVFHVVGEAFENVFSEPSPFRRVTLGIDVFDSAEVSTAAENCFQEIVEAMDLYSINTGKLRLILRPSSARKVYNAEAGVWQVGGDFLVDILVA